MKACRLASRENFVGKCGNLKFNTHIYRKLVKVRKTRVSSEMVGSGGEALEAGDKC